MFTHTIDPVFLRIFGLEIRYYGLIYALGLLITYFYLVFITKREEIPNFKTKHVDTFLTGLILSIIIGARFFHVFIYYPNHYFLNPLEIVQVWRGGLSFHGGLLFATGWIFYFAKKHKIQFFRITDALLLPVVFFLGLGRIANFINGELRGIVTNSTIGVFYPDEGLTRLPTQLFESAKNFAIFGLLMFMTIFRNKLFKKYVPGLLTIIFLITYGIFRFIIEFFKDFDKILLGLNMGQILSLSMIFVGLILFWRWKHF